MVSARIPEGEVFDSAKLKNTIRFLIENDMRNIVIDLGSLEYLYSDTINAFIASNRHMLEVSGRIAILTEHPKVQDILKRAGLDNIMRIYRSEAEMVADSKEILRQTSSYRIEELQKYGQPGSLPSEPVIPKTEFDDFRSAIGDSLGTKLENNEVPQYQYGTPPAAFTPPPTPPPPTAPPSYGGYPQQPYVPQTPAYGQAPAFPAQPTQPPQHPSYPANTFDFPTVQIPAGGYGASTGHSLSSPPPAPEGQDPAGEEGEDQRGRKVSQDRMRSPSARKQSARRVGGREEVQSREVEPEFSRDDARHAPEPAMTSPVYPQEHRDMAPPPVQPSYSQPVLSPAQQQPILPPNFESSRITTGSPLIDERRSGSRTLLFVGFIILVAAVLGVFFIMKSGKPSPKPVAEGQTESQPTPAEKPVVPPAPTATPATPATTPATPTAITPPTPPPVANTPPMPKPVAHPTPEPEKPKPESHVARTPKTPMVKTGTKVRVPAGSILITSNPSGAEVLINYSKKGVTPITVPLLNNVNRVLVKLNGYKRYETSISKNSKDRELNVELEAESGDATPAAASETKPEPKAEVKPEEPAPAPKVEAVPPPKPEPVVEEKPAPKPVAKVEPPKPKPEPDADAGKSGFAPGTGAPGRVFLSSNPIRASILVDGKPTNKSTPTFIELPSGTHRIEMMKDGLKGSTETEIKPGKNNQAVHLILQ